MPRLRLRRYALSLLVALPACSSTGEPATAAGTGGGSPLPPDTTAAASTAIAASSSGSGGGSSSSASSGSGGAGGEAPGSCILAGDTGLAKSKWVYVDTDGKLAYKTLPTGERILDFSQSGYRGGGVAIPVVPVVKTVNPSGGDDTAAIQAAIDAVSALPASNGLRGAVLLGPGKFAVKSTLSITTSGVVLRGSGSGATGTVLALSGAPRAAISIQGKGSWQTVGKGATITDAYVPSGATSFHVDSAAGLQIGDHVLVDRPVTAAWIKFMGMDKLVRNGMPETWIGAGTIIHTDRTIAAISGNQITLDVPLSDSYDAQYTKPGVEITPYTFDGRIEQVGLESMRIVAPAASVPISDPIFSVLDMNAVIDGWVKDVVADESTNGFSIGATSKRITVEDAVFNRVTPIDGSAGYPFSYAITGTQTLVMRSSTHADKVYSYATMARVSGPNVLLDFKGTGNWTRIEPHQRWATGLLLDGVDSPGGSINLIDRGYLGSGHGWTIGFAVAWNGVAMDLTVQQPPGAQNWAIGASGALKTQAEAGKADTTPMPSGITESIGKAVAPRSLYLAQLCERLGPQALANIGY
jgi:hypothetical protein